MARRSDVVSAFIDDDVIRSIEQTYNLRNLTRDIQNAVKSSFKTFTGKDRAPPMTPWGNGGSVYNTSVNNLRDPETGAVNESRIQSFIEDLNEIAGRIVSSRNVSDDDQREMLTSRIREAYDIQRENSFGDKGLKTVPVNIEAGTPEYRSLRSIVKKEGGQFFNDAKTGTAYIRYDSNADAKEYKKDDGTPVNLEQVVTLNTESFERKYTERKEREAQEDIARRQAYAEKLGMDKNALMNTPEERLPFYKTKSKQVENMESFVNNPEMTASLVKASSTKQSVIQDANLENLKQMAFDANMIDPNTGEGMAVEYLATQNFHPNEYTRFPRHIVEAANRQRLLNRQEAVLNDPQHLRHRLENELALKQKKDELLESIHTLNRNTPEAQDYFRRKQAQAEKEIYESLTPEQKADYDMLERTNDAARKKEAERRYYAAHPGTPEALRYQVRTQKEADRDFYDQLSPAQQTAYDLREKRNEDRRKDMALDDYYTQVLSSSAPTTKQAAEANRYFAQKQKKSEEDLYWSQPESRRDLIDQAEKARKITDRFEDKAFQDQVIDDYYTTGKGKDTVEARDYFATKFFREQSRDKRIEEARIEQLPENIKKFVKRTNKEAKARESIVENLEMSEFRDLVVDEYYTTGAGKNSPRGKEYREKKQRKADAERKRKENKELEGPQWGLARKLHKWGVPVKAAKVFGTIGTAAIVVAAIVALGKLLYGKLDKLISEVIKIGALVNQRYAGSISTGIESSRVALYDAFKEASQKRNRPMDVLGYYQAAANRLGNIVTEGGGEGLKTVMRNMAGLYAAYGQTNRLEKNVDHILNNGDVSIPAGDALAFAAHSVLTGKKSLVSNAPMSAQEAGAYIEQAYGGQARDLLINLIAELEHSPIRSEAVAHLDNVVKGREEGRYAVDEVLKLISPSITTDQQKDRPNVNDALTQAERELQRIMQSFAAALTALRSELLLAFSPKLTGAMQELQNIILTVVAKLGRSLGVESAGVQYAIHETNQTTMREAERRRQSSIATAQRSREVSRAMLTGLAKEVYGKDFMDSPEWKTKANERYRREKGINMYNLPKAEQDKLIEKEKDLFFEQWYKAFGTGDKFGTGAVPFRLLGGTKEQNAKRYAIFLQAMGLEETAKRDTAFAAEIKKWEDTPHNPSELWKTPLAGKSAASNAEDVEARLATFVADIANAIFAADLKNIDSSTSAFKFIGSAVDWGHAPARAAQSQFQGRTITNEGVTGFNFGGSLREAGIISEYANVQELFDSMIPLIQQMGYTFADVRRGVQDMEVVVDVKPKSETFTLMPTTRDGKPLSKDAIVLNVEAYLQTPRGGVK